MSAGRTSSTPARLALTLLLLLAVWREAGPWTALALALVYAALELIVATLADMRREMRTPTGAPAAPGE